LIVWAIDEGRRCASAVREWLDERHGAGTRAATFVSIANDNSRE
jgi:hypothetical protein